MIFNTSCSRLVPLTGVLAAAICTPAIAEDTAKPLGNNVRVGTCFGVDISCVLFNAKIEYAGENYGISLSGLTVYDGDEYDVYAGSSVKRYRKQSSGDWFGLDFLAYRARSYVYAGAGWMAMNNEPELIVGAGVGKDYHFGPKERFILQLFVSGAYSFKAHLPLPGFGIATVWAF